MEEEEVREVLHEFRDAHSEQRLIDLLKDCLIEELEEWDISTGRQKHNLNLKIRELEEELDYIESSKLAEFDPEQF